MPNLPGASLAADTAMFERMLLTLALALALTLGLTLGLTLTLNLTLPLTCFKVDVHLMPNLPGASLAADTAMFERMLRDEAMQADQWKIYPTQVVPG